MDEPSDFDPDDFDFDALPDGFATEAFPNDCQVFRAVIAKGRITMTRWQPGLAEGGPLGQAFRARECDGVVIADLRLIRTSDGAREVIVEFMAAGRARRRAERRLLKWAALTGYRRIWFPDRPVDIEPAFDLIGGTAQVTCPSCAAEWTDSTPAFWNQTHNLGYFPTACPACGNTLPQWTAVAADTTGCRGSAAPARRGASSHGQG